MHQQRIYTMCFRMLGDSDAGADATQDTFISAFRKIHTFRGGSFRAWITRIATNTCYDVLRKRKRHPTISLDTPIAGREEESTSLDPPDPGESLDDFAMRRELSETIQHMLACIPEDQRIVVILSDIQGMSYQEISDITGAPLGTVKSRLSRGRGRLRDLLQERELLPPRYRYSK
jgi:RNA polymerase sigma-70 factor (ECF subfamily)